MKTTFVSSRNTRRHPAPELPQFGQGRRNLVLTAEAARKIIRAHGGRPLTRAEKKKLIAAGLWGIPKE